MKRREFMKAVGVGLSGGYLLYTAVLQGNCRLDDHLIHTRVYLKVGVKHVRRIGKIT